MRVSSAHGSAFALGASTLVFAVGWVRMLLVTAGTSRLAFEAVALTVGVGLLLGAVAGARRTPPGPHAAAGLALAGLALASGLAGAASLIALPALHAVGTDLSMGLAPPASLALRVGLASPALLIPSLLSGAAVGGLTRRGASWTPALLGAAVGAALAQLLLLPSLGIRPSFLGAALLTLLAAALAWRR